MKRSLYCVFLALHPRDFRRRFGPEMAAIFEEAGQPAWLLRDALTSALRQWIQAAGLRLLAIVALTLGPLLAVMWLLVPVPGSANSGTAPSELFYLIVAVVAVFTSAVTVVLSLTWRRIRRPLRRPAALGKHA